MQTATVPMDSLAQLIMLQLEKNKRANLTVTGCSMMPMLRHRKDQVVLIPLAGNCKPGDIILYRRENGRYVLHRIIRLIENGYICCGDNQAEEEIVMHDQLIAIVNSFIRNGKTYTVDDFWYRAYTLVWVKLFWLRPMYIKARRPIGRFLGEHRKKMQRKNIDRKRG